MPSPARFASSTELIPERLWPAPRASHKPGSAATARLPLSSSAQKGADFAPEGVEVDQKGVVPLDAGELGKARGDACGRERACDGLLLGHREQQVRLHADHEGTAQRGAAEQ